VNSRKGIKNEDSQLSKKVKLPSASNLLSPEGWFLPEAGPPLVENISCPIFISAIWKIF
jgi:hypothetical protein